jgi:hypothetical protein
MRRRHPPEPVHVPGTMRGERLSLDQGKEPGRSAKKKYYRSARDSTGISAENRGPILPTMPDIPPA